MKNLWLGLTSHFDIFIVFEMRTYLRISIDPHQETDIKSILNSSMYDINKEINNLIVVNKTLPSYTSSSSVVSMIKGPT